VNINLVTYPDKLYDDYFQLLLISPSDELKKSLQSEFLSAIENDINIYLYDTESYEPSKIDWLVDIFMQVDCCVIDLDNIPSYLKDLLSFFICRSKTYWLTKSQDSMYTHISKNKVYTLDFLFQKGGFSGET